MSNATKTPEMSKPQVDYFAAFALYQQAEASAEAAIKEHLSHTPGETEEQWEAIEIAADATRDNYGVHELRRLLLDAERAMVDWSTERAKRIATPAQRAEIDAMRARVELRPTLWRRMVETAARHAA